MTLIMCLVGAWLVSAAIVLNIADYAPLMDDD